MRIISHRGNLKGPDKQENTVQAIHRALILGYDVEVDVWMEHGKLYLGHDYGQYWVQNEEMLRDERIWIHAKNLDALTYLLENFKEPHIFWHQEDDYTLTSKGTIWTYPGKAVSRSSIIVALEPWDIEEAFNEKPMGICTDNPEYLRSLLEKTKNEKRYTEYVYNCGCVEETPITFREFEIALKNGKCEVCLVHPTEKCECNG